METQSCMQAHVCHACMGDRKRDSYTRGSVEIAKRLRAGTRAPKLAVLSVIKFYEVPEVAGTWSLFTLVKEWGVAPIPTMADDGWEGACDH